MPQTRTSFDKDWQVHVGDDLAPSRRVLAKAGTANGWSDLTKEELGTAGLAQTVVESMGAGFQVVKSRPSSADADWLNVDLPHDWRLGMKPSPDHPVPADYPRVWQGFFPPGVAYYRKVFKSPALAEGDHASITFGGIAGYSDIWFNGFWVGQQSTAYSSISIDVTEFLRSEREGPNVLLVRADSMEAEGWWYEGGGIYRHVWIETYNEVHVAKDGLYVTTPNVSEAEATVSWEVEICNNGRAPAKVAVVVVIEDMESNVEVARSGASQPTIVETCGGCTIRGFFDLPNPKLWGLGNGQLYRLTVNVVDADQTIRDAASTQFGVRKIEWVDDGILVNGQWAKLYGANIHQDWAIYGIGLPDRVVEQKLELCAEIGVNAIRTAHHAPTPELVDHADRMGMLLLLEHRLLSTSSSSIDQLRSLVRQFRSRPSVLLWGIENEEMDFQGSPVGHAMLTRLVKEIKSLDPHRHTIFGGVVNTQDASYYSIADVVGMHYRCFFGVLDQSIAYLPERPHVLDEEGLYPSTRGVYQYDKERAYAGSLSTLRDVMMDNAQPAANAALMPLDFKITGNVAGNLTEAYTHPKVSGTFVWAALDYMGEPTPQRWPATTSSYGARDLCGLPKDYYWLLRSLFRRERLVHAFPHWSWAGREGERLPFRAYTNCESVEFVVNGVSVERQVAKGSLVVAPEGLEYQAGELIVRGYDGDRLVAEHRQVTAGPASQLIVEADRTKLGTSGLDVAFLRVAIADKDGNLIPDAEVEVHFVVKGEGRLVGAHNADPSSHDYKSFDRATTFNGFVGVYVGTLGGGRDSNIVFEATAENLQPMSIVLTVSGDEVEHRVHVAADEAKNKLFGVHTYSKCG